MAAVVFSVSTSRILNFFTVFSSFLWRCSWSSWNVYSLGWDSRFRLSPAISLREKPRLRRLTGKPRLELARTGAKNKDRDLAPPYLSEGEKKRPTALSRFGPVLRVSTWGSERQRPHVL